MSEVTQSGPLPSGLNLNDVQDVDAKEPFVVTLGSRNFELQSISTVDFRELRQAQKALAESGDTEPLIRIMVMPQDRKEFFAEQLPTFKLSALLEAYNIHYGLQTP